MLSRGEWESAEAEGQLTLNDVLDRLTGIALHEFGTGQETWPIAVDEDGFITALIAEGIQMQGGVTLRVWPNDHPPPHVHIERPGEPDIVINLETGAVVGELPRGVRSKQLKKFRTLIDQQRALLAALWAKTEAADS